MKCPNCDRELVMSDRNGVEIDYCPGCRGVWLDRGELDKIIERSNQFSQSDSRKDYDSHKDYKDDKRGEQSHQQHKKKKGGFLGDLFDF